MAMSNLQSNEYSYTKHAQERIAERMGKKATDRTKERISRAIDRQRLYKQGNRVGFFHAGCVWEVALEGLTVVTVLPKKHAQNSNYHARLRNAYKKLTK